MEGDIVQMVLMWVQVWLVLAWVVLLSVLAML